MKRILFIMVLIMTFSGCYSVTNIEFERKNEINDNNILSSIYINPIYGYETTLFYLKEKNSNIRISFYFLTEKIIESIEIYSCKLIIDEHVIEFTSNDLLNFYLGGTNYYSKNNYSNEIRLLETNLVLKKDVEMANIRNIFSKQLERKILLKIDYKILFIENEKQYEDEYQFNSKGKIINYTPNNLWKGDR